MSRESNASIYLLTWARSFPGRDLVVDHPGCTLVNYRNGVRWHAVFATLGAAVDAIESFRIGWVRA